MKKESNISTEEIKKWLELENQTGSQDETVHEIEDTLISFAHKHAVNPPDELRGKILAKLGKLNEQRKDRKELDINKLPLLDLSSNWLDWAVVIQNIIPPEEYENVHLHPLESHDERELFVAWVKEFVEEEVHHDLLESFLILEGSCECHITDTKGESRIVRLHQGDYICMQTGEVHDITITSPQPAKAILQWLKLTA